jgi:hypothetical protein
MDVADLFMALKISNKDVAGSIIVISSREFVFDSVII